MKDKTLLFVNVASKCGEPSRRPLGATLNSPYLKLGPWVPSTPAVDLPGTWWLGADTDPPLQARPLSTRTSKLFTRSTATRVSQSLGSPATRLVTQTLPSIGHTPVSADLAQFKGQEPGTDDEVLQFCQANYGVTFPIAKKVSKHSRPPHNCADDSRPTSTDLTLSPSGSSSRSTPTLLSRTLTG